MSERRDGEATAPTGLEDRLGRIESIVDRLERDDLELQEALDLFEEGIAHVREAYAVLEHGRLRVEKLVVDLDGAVTLERDPAGE